MAEQLPMAIRIETECRRRFESYSKHGRLLTARLFGLAGYYAADSIRAMREPDRQYFRPTSGKG